MNGEFQTFQKFLPVVGLRFSNDKINVTGRSNKPVSHDGVTADEHERQFLFICLLRNDAEQAHGFSQRLVMDMRVRGGDEAFEQRMRLVRLA